METSTKSMDRLSELPDSLIHHILGFLPMNYVVRTMVLSKQWKNLWSTTTCLTFDDTEMGSDSICTDRFVRFVYRVLMSWKGSKIQEFGVLFLSRHDESLNSDIDVWVRFAMEKGVERLHVELKNQDFDEKHDLVLWSPPQCLYSCSSLRELSIFECNLQINGNVDVEWHNLKELYIEGCGFTQSLINQVLAGSPKLGVLMVTLYEKNESFSIQSSSLRYLQLHKIMWRGCDDITIPSELRICAPNLETLKLYGFPYSKCLLMNVSSLTDVALRFCTDGVFSGNYDFLGETLAQILPTIKHVEQLRLSDCCIMALGAMEMKNMLANVKFLKLNHYGFQKYQQILANIPKLETLVLQPVAKYSRSCEHRVVEAKRLEISNLPSSSSSITMQQLTRVYVTWRDALDDSIFPNIEILLKCASELQKLEFRVQGLPNSSLLAAQTKLLGMPRSSPTAQLICYEC